MRLSFILLLFGINLSQGGFAQAANPSASAPFTSPQAKELYLKINSALPLEMKHVVYFMNDPNGSSLTPAYVDMSTMTAYSWAGVTLQADQIPRYFTKRSDGSGVIFPKDPAQSNLQFKEIAPPTFYMLLPDGKYAEGYFDNGNGIYYRWGDLEFDKSRLPADAVSKNRILPLQAGTVSTIPPPSPNAPKSSGAVTPTNPPDQTSSTSAQTLPANPTPVAPAPAAPLAQVQPTVETGIPWWLYGIVVFSIVILVAAGYYLSKRSGKGP